MEQRRSRDAAAEAKKYQRQLLDMRQQADEDHRLVGELNDQVGTLQTKIVTLKRQVEESVCRFTYNSSLSSVFEITQQQYSSLVRCSIEPTGRSARNNHEQISQNPAATRGS